MFPEHLAAQEANMCGYVQTLWTVSEVNCCVFVCTFYVVSESPYRDMQSHTLGHIQTYSMQPMETQKAEEKHKHTQTHTHTLFHKYLPKYAHRWE